MVILSCTPPTGAKHFGQAGHRAVTAVQKETSSHAFEMSWHIQEGAGKKKKRLENCTFLEVQITLGCLK